MVSVDVWPLELYSGKKLGLNVHETITNKLLSRGVPVSESNESFIKVTPPGQLFVTHINTREVEFINLTYYGSKKELN